MSSESRERQQSADEKIEFTSSFYQRRITRFKSVTQSLIELGDETRKVIAIQIIYPKSKISHVFIFIFFHIRLHINSERGRQEGEVQKLLGTHNYCTDQVVVVVECSVIVCILFRVTSSSVQQFSAECLHRTLNSNSTQTIITLMFIAPILMAQFLERGHYMFAK